ncbi:MAG: SPOR domain-containing protein [Halioglobus sp.]
MNETLKQRLVGALILVALGVVFWPIIFVQPAQQPQAQIESIPPRPSVSTVPLQAPDSSGLRGSPDIAAAQTPEPVQPVQKDVKPQAEAEDDPAVKSPKPQPTTPVRREAPQPLAIDGDGVPLAFILQVVTVSDSAKAEGIRARLERLGHKAYIKKVAGNGATLHRVYIGPKFERAKLEKLKPGIDETFGVSSMVVRYLP